MMILKDVRNTYLAIETNKKVMVGNRRKGGNNKQSVYSSYDCPRRADSICTCKGVKKEAIENAVLNVILEQLKNDNLNRVAKKVNEYRNLINSPNSSRIKKIRIAINDIDYKIKNILDFIMTGNAPVSLNNKLQELESDKDNLIVFVK